MTEGGVGPAASRCGAALPRGRKHMARILLIEDDATFRDLVATSTRRAGYDVHCAGDGQAGWDGLDKAAPDLILLDLAMPRLDGLSFLRRLRAHEKWGSV